MTHKGIYLGQGQDGKMLSYPGDRHLMLIGPNGSGKGARLLTQNVAFLTDRSLFIVDPKGETAAMTIGLRRKLGDVVVLNPFGLHVDTHPALGLASTGFNPLNALDPTSETFPDDCAGLAEAMIRIEGKDPHWAASAQDLLAALIMHEKLENGGQATFGNVRRMLTEPTLYEILEDGKRGAPIGGLRHTANFMSISDDEALAAKASRFTESRDELDSIVSTAITQTRFLDSRPIAADLGKGSGFRFGAMKRRTITVYLILPAKRLRTHSGWVRLIVQAALNDLYETMPDRSRPPVLMLLDELPAAIGNLPIVEDAMGLARGYGVQLWPVVQDLNQLKDLYEARWETFIANTGALLTFAPRDFSTADYLSKLSGMKTEVVQSLSYGSSDQASGSGSSENLSFSTQGVPLFRPEALMGMAEGVALCFSHLAQGPVICRLPAYWEMEALRPHLAPNPYYRT
ncbi:TraG/TraD family (plasmid) [Roseomonas mucosa]|uniref:TraG/TraD family n=1 Tax=Roseomonas mucosa TaxID=207340 RepID=A0A4Y1MQT1_9PROT|nr:TraG/TraD family [Roseomonas mucosa]